MGFKILKQGEEPPRPRRSNKGSRVKFSEEYQLAIAKMTEGFNPYERGAQIDLIDRFFAEYGKSGGRIMRNELMAFRDKAQLKLDIVGPYKDGEGNLVIFIDARPISGKPGAYAQNFPPSKGGKRK